MLPTVLKIIYEGNELEGITKETLLSRIQKLPHFKSTSYDDLNSQFNLALDDGRRFGLLSVKGSRVKLLYNFYAREESRNFSALLLMMKENLDNDMDVEGGSHISTPLESGVFVPGQQCERPNRTKNSRVTFARDFPDEEFSDFEHIGVGTNRSFGGALSNIDQGRNSSSKPYRNGGRALLLLSSWFRLGPVARSLLIILLLCLFLKWCDA